MKKLGWNDGACEAGPPPTACRLSESFADESIDIAGRWWADGRADDPTVTMRFDVLGGTDRFSEARGWGFHGYDVDHFYVNLYLTRV